MLRVGCIGSKVLRRSTRFSSSNDGDFGDRIGLFNHVPVSPTVIESNEAGGWRFIQDILPPIQIPQPDLDREFPTPSGWQPPAADLADRAYPVRNKYQSLLQSCN